MPRYAEQEDLAQVGLNSDLTADLATGVADAALDKRSKFADGYLKASGKFTLPLTAWGDDLTLAVCQLAAWDLLSIIGFNADDANNQVWQTRRDEALSWLKDVAAGRVIPADTADSTPDVDETGLVMDSMPLRGWAPR